MEKRNISQLRNTSTKALFTTQKKPTLLSFSRNFSATKQSLRSDRFAQNKYNISEKTKNRVFLVDKEVKEKEATKA
jgi:hypothetical protein